MENGFSLLVEKEAMWAQMLLQVLKDNGIPCTAIPVYGAGLVAKTGMQERLKVFVPTEYSEQASRLLHEIFPGDIE